MSDNYEPTEDQMRAIAVAFQDTTPIYAQLDRASGFYLVSMLQLALRHPANTGVPAARMRAFARELQGRIAPDGGVLHDMLEKGWDPTCDAVPARAFRSTLQRRRSS